MLSLDASLLRGQLWQTTACLVISVSVVYGARQYSKSKARNAWLKQHGYATPNDTSTWWPFGIDILWVIHKKAGSGRLLQVFMDAHRRLGNTFIIKLFGMKELTTTEPANVEALLLSQFADFGCAFRNSYGPFTFFGDGILTQDGAAWKHSREMLRRHFRRSRRETLEIIWRPTETFIELVPIDQPCHFQSYFEMLLLDVTVKTLFGADVESQHPTYGPDITALNNAMNTAYSYLCGEAGWIDKYWINGKGAFGDAVNICHSFIDRYIEVFQADQGSGILEKGTEGYQSSPYLPTLLADTPSPVDRRSCLLQLFLASRDTTAITLHWTFLMLAKYPAELHKLREEVSSQLEDDPSRAPNPEDLKQMKYLNFVIKEVLRLYPPVAMNTRQALKDTSLPAGGGPDGKSPIGIFKGDSLSYNVFCMHRREDLYGADAYEFRPSRWDPETEEGANLKNIGMGYLPFHGGPRTCLGQEVALLEASYIIVRLLQSFSRFEEAPGHELHDPGEEKLQLRFLASPHRSYQMIFRR